MRITNKIMQNNALVNINRNKVLQDTLNTQIATQKKIARPSDDPVTAIRSLRLRTNLAEIDQYYTKNVGDAENWLGVTEDALGNVTDAVTKMYDQCTKGSSSNLETTDRETILESLKALRDEIYTTGNVDYAGRNIFAGYRTDLDLAFTEDTTQTFALTEQMSLSDLSDITYVDSGNLTDLNETNYAAATDEEAVATSSVHCLRLSYDNTDAAGVDPNTLLMRKTGVDASGNNIYAAITTDVTVVSSTAVPSPYNQIASSTGVILVPETGELLISDTVYATMQALPTDTEIAVNYPKSNWDKGDLRPEHYFACTSGTVSYNSDFLTENKADAQVIEYAVGANQSLRVNTLANEVYTHDIGRDVDDLIAVTEAVGDMEDVVEKLESMLKDTSFVTATVQEKLDAANKSLTLLNEKMQKMFESGITKMQEYLDQTNLAVTNVGNRSARLELVENRLKAQQTSFKALATENDGADITEAAVKLSSAELSYNAALAATGKIIQNSLMNFI